MRICGKCNINPLEKYAKLCTGCRSLCSKCGIRDRATSHAYCNACHARAMRSTRPRYSELPEERRKKEAARALAKYYLKKGLLERKSCCAGDCDLPADMHQPNPDWPLRLVWACKKHWRRMQIRTEATTPAQSL